MNKILITGRMTRDADMKTTAGGMEYCNISVAVDRRKGKDGTKKTDFFNCTGWGKTSAFINQYFHKGDGIVLTGRMESNKSDKDGHIYWTLTIDEVEFPIAGKRGDAAAENPLETPAPEVDAQTGMQAVNTDELPF